MEIDNFKETQAVEEPRRRFGLSGNALKFIAIFAMLLDHIAYIFLPAGGPLYTIMRFIGRITGPTMFFFIVEGYHKTSNKNKYTLRLAIFAVVSYFPFIFAIHGLPSPANFLKLNVIYTLLLGLLAVRARNEIKNTILKYIVIAALVVLSILGDWHYLAVIIILAFDVFYGDFKKQAFAYILILLGLVSYMAVLLTPFQNFLGTRVFDFGIYKQFAVQFGMLLPIILLYFYNGQKGKGARLSKWGFYIFYPAHLLALGLIAYFTIRQIV